MSSYTGIAAFINITIMVHKDTIVGRPSQNRKGWGGRGLQSGRPGFVFPWEKMDDQCHADDDLGLLNCQRRKTLHQPPALTETSRSRIRRSWVGRGRAARLAGQVGGGNRLVAEGGGVEVMRVSSQAP